MKSNTPMEQGNTLDPESNALNPAGPHEKTWGSFAIFNIWANDVQSLFGYTLVASLFISYGVGGWTAFAGLITAGLFVMWMVNLSGAPGEKYGIPYPVLARASLGTEGAKLPAMLRSTVAIFWYGVQVYFASTALALLIRAVTGASGGATYLGLTGIDWMSFLIVWALHIVIFWRGMRWVETFLNIAGPFVYLVMIALVTSVIGTAIGYFAQTGIAWLLRDLLRSELPRAREHFIRWYSEHARSWLALRVKNHQARMDLIPSGVRVQDLGYRWGSCGKGAQLYFHWKTILLPKPIAEYVVVHEMVHLQEPHHTPEFWLHLERVMPDYAQRKTWLAEHGIKVEGL